MSAALLGDAAPAPVGHCGADARAPPPTSTPTTRRRGIAGGSHGQRIDCSGGARSSAVVEVWVKVLVFARKAHKVHKTASERLTDTGDGHIKALADRVHRDHQGGELIEGGLAAGGS